MNVFDPVVVELVDTLRAIKMQVLGSFGPLAPVVTGVGEIMAAAIAVILLVAGRGFFAPPMPEMPQLPARLAGAVTGVSMVGLLIWSRVDPGAPILFWAATLIALGLLGAFVYALLRLSLTFRCPYDKTLQVKGLWRTRNAKKRMRGEPTGNPVYDVPGQAPPVNTREYFCGSKSNPYLVWPQPSRAAAQVVLMASFLVFIVPLTVSLAGASIALMQLEVTESAKTVQIDLPADVLFDFDKPTLRPAAIDSLQKTAQILRNRQTAAARIQGHTDARGTAEHNATLSVDRANAVKAWLVNDGGLAQIAFTVEGFGATQPVAPDRNPDGSDNPEGRQQNRRVTILIEK
jgi:outer membrane protein OmpA-like peptidoglycan-associated protein